MKKISYGVFRYDTNNVGDEVQSIAARRFLPRVDYYVNRDNIDATETKGETLKMVMNGWYMSPWKNDGKVHWPPKAKNLDPLLISMHIDSLNGTTEYFVADKSLEFLKAHSPVGCRDTDTAEFLKKNGVDSYFSGCLTLTILPDKRIKRRDFVLAVDVSDKVYKKIVASTNRRVIRIDAAHAKALANDEKFALAEYWLYLYQSAWCVVSARLHTILPCLALGTPVIAIAGRDPKRYSGLIDLANHYSESAFLKTALDYDNPPGNPGTFTNLRDKLVKKCKEHTGFDSKSSFLNGKTPDELLYSVELQSALAKSVGDANQLELLKLDYDALFSEHNRLLSDFEHISWELKDAQNPGVKRSLSYLRAACKKYVKKHVGKS